MENRIAFNIKTAHYIQHLRSETMKLHTSTKNKITKNGNGENVHHLEITELVLVHCNLVNNGYQHHSRVFYTFVTNKSCGQLLDFSPKKIIFKKPFHILKYSLWIKILHS